MTVSRQTPKAQGQRDHAEQPDNVGGQLEESDSSRTCRQHEHEEAGRLAEHDA